MALNREISLDAGDIHLSIKETGESIDFNPQDLNFINKFYEIDSEISSKQKIYNEKYAIIKKMPNKTPSDKQRREKADLKLVNEFCDYCDNLYNNLFGAGASIKIFAGQRVIGKYVMFFEKLKLIIIESRETVTSEYEDSE